MLHHPDNDSYVQQRDDEIEEPSGTLKQDCGIHNSLANSASEPEQNDSVPGTAIQQQQQQQANEEMEDLSFTDKLTRTVDVEIAIPNHPELNEVSPLEQPVELVPSNADTSALSL
jgi:hypothetical protein